MCLAATAIVPQQKLQGLWACVGGPICRKTKWSRSSRTDKGVHSLATVIGLRILMHDEDYDTGKGRAPMHCKGLSNDMASFSAAQQPHSAHVDVQ